MTSLKKILFGLIGLAIVVILSLIAIPLFVDINQHKPEIEQALKKHAHMDVHIQGDIELSLFPWIGIGLNDLTINDPSEFGNTPLFHAQQIKINAKLLPLFKKTLEMKTVTLDSVTVKLITLNNGSTNLDHFSETGTPPEDSLSESSSITTENNATPLTALSLGGVQITNATITYQDATSQTEIKIEQLNLNTGRISFDHPIELTSNAIIHSLDTGSDATVTIAATIALSKDLQNITLQKLSIESTLENKQLPEPMAVTLSGSSNVDLKKQTLVSEFSINSDDLHLNISAQGKHILDAPSMNGTIQIDTLNARALAEKFAGKLDMANADALKSVAFSTQFDATDKEISLKNINFTLDQTVFQGSSRIALIKPHYDFSLKANALNLDHYLPPTIDDNTTATSTTNNAQPKTTQANIDTELLPVSTLRDLSINGQLSLESLIVSGMELKNVTVHSTANKGIIKIAPLKAIIYEGSIKNDVTINVQGKSPVITIKNAIKGVQAGPLGKALMGKEQVTGTVNLEAQWKAHGNTEQAIQNSLTGSTHFNFGDGAIQGINIAETIRQAKAKLQGKTLAPSTAPQKTDFTELVGDISIRNMKIYNKNLSMKSPYLRIQGHGDIDLNQETINYLTDVKIIRSSTGQTGKGLQDLAGLTIPIRVGGTFDNPSYYPDIKRVIKKQATKKVRQQLKKQLQKKIGIDLNKLF